MTRPFASYSLVILPDKFDGLLDIGIFRYLLLDAILSDSSFLKASFLISDAILLSIKIGGLEFTATVLRFEGSLTGGGASIFGGA